LEIIEILNHYIPQFRLIIIKYMETSKGIYHILAYNDHTIYKIMDFLPMADACNYTLVSKRFRTVFLRDVNIPGKFLQNAVDRNITSNTTSNTAGNTTSNTTNNTTNNTTSNTTSGGGDSYHKSILWLLNNLKNVINDNDKKVIMKYLCDKDQIVYLNHIIKNDLIDSTSNDNTLMGWAYVKRNYDMMYQLLLDDRVDFPFDQNKFLKHLCLQGHATHVLLFLEHEKCNVTEDGHLISKTYNKNHFDVVEILLEDGRFTIERQYPYRSLFKTAISDRKLRIIKLILCHSGFNPDAVDMQRLYLNIYTHNNVIKLLLEDGKLNFKLNDLLWEASRVPNRWNVYPSTKHDGVELKDILIDTGYHEIIELIINHPKYVYVEKDSSLLSTLYLNKYYDSVKLLLKDARFNPSYDRNLLFTYMWNGYKPDLLELLLKHDKFIICGRLNEVLSQCGRHSENYNTIEVLLQDPKFDSFWDNFFPEEYPRTGLIDNVINHNEIRTIKLLLKHKKIKSYNEILERALRYNNNRVLKLLIKEPDFNPFNNTRLLEHTSNNWTSLPSLFERMTFSDLRHILYTFRGTLCWYGMLGLLGLLILFMTLGIIGFTIYMNYE
jgi:hypothetical protein